MKYTNSKFVVYNLKTDFSELKFQQSHWSERGNSKILPFTDNNTWINIIKSRDFFIV